MVKSTGGILNQPEISLVLVGGRSRNSTHGFYLVASLVAKDGGCLFRTKERFALLRANNHWTAQDRFKRRGSWCFESDALGDPTVSIWKEHQSLFRPKIQPEPSVEPHFVIRGLGPGASNVRMESPPFHKLVKLSSSNLSLSTRYPKPPKGSESRKEFPLLSSFEPLRFYPPIP